MARDEWGEDSRLWIGAERYQNGDVDSFKWSNNDAFSLVNLNITVFQLLYLEAIGVHIFIFFIHPDFQLYTLGTRRTK